MYRFKNDEALDLFIRGLECAYENDVADAVDFLGQATEIEPDNPYIYNYLVMMSEFNKATDSELVALCVEWERVAVNSGIESQIARSKHSYDFYASTQEERIEALKSYGENIKKLILHGKR
jgi:hypothetical protein